MKITLKYEGGKQATFEKGKPKFVVREIDGIEWSTRSGKVRLADGTEHDAILEFCDHDSGEHYGTGIWTESGVAWQDEADFLSKLGKTKEQVYPYKYKYAGYIEHDHHIGDDGWSI